jgi:cytoskeleton protein RodZ
MSSTLGEKLRQAREERGISISEVAEQTRISPLYIESIENDNYKPLPGGIFNKGFVKSYAKYVGVDEHEALQEYARLAATIEAQEAEPPRSYRPEVLTDDRPGVSILPTVLFAGVILALMTAGILFLVRYLRSPETSQTASNTQANSAANIASPAEPSAAAPSSAPAIEASKIEFRAAGQPVWLRAIVDGKSTEMLIDADKSAAFEPKDNLKLSYSRSRAPYAALAINGKTVTLPSEPTSATKGTIDVEITRENFAEIWQAGKVGAGSSNVAREAVPANRSAPARPKPSPSPGAAQPKASPTPSRPASTAPRPTPR